MKFARLDFSVRLLSQTFLKAQIIASKYNIVDETSSANWRNSRKATFRRGPRDESSVYLTAMAKLVPG